MVCALSLAVCRGSDVNSPRATTVLVCAAAMLWVACGTGRAAEADAGEPAPLIQVTGRIIHTWYERPGLRIMLVIDGFTVMTAKEQLTARDGVVWFDEQAATASGKATLGVYAETGVAYKAADGKVETFDSVYLVMESAGVVARHCDGPERGKAEETELFLRAKRLRQEYLASGRRETPITVTPPPEPPEQVEPPGVREAGIPQEITIISQDDVRQVNFTSFVEKQTDEQGREIDVRVSIWTGGVYVTCADMEMAADNLVIWAPEEAVRAAGRPEPTPDETTPPDEEPPKTEPGLPEPAGAAPAGTSESLAAEAYLEGHVRISQRRRILQCNQLFYDFRRHRALAIDTKIRTFSKVRNVPVYYYADEVRQLARGLFVGTNARMTTCEFAHPHYTMGGKQMTLTDLTPLPGEDEERPEYRRVRFAGKDVTFRVRSLPLAYWPTMAGDVEEDVTALRTIRIENRSNRGTGVATQWHLMRLLGIDAEPEGFSMYLNADAWSERGPALGIEADYSRKDFYGEFLTYFIRDSGKDSVGSRDVEAGSQNRGRILWRHRHYLPQNWELTLELSKITDPNFLNEFYEQEDETGKTQETLLYLKKQESDPDKPADQALTLLITQRLNDWQTLTDYYPQIGYNMIGRSLWDDHLTYFQDSEFSLARFRPTEELPIRGSNTTIVADTIHEVDLPLKLGVVNLVPFVEGRASYFGETLLRSGNETRYAARAGARAATQAWRVWEDVESDFWDLHRLRHVNIFDASVFAATNNVESRTLIPFDVAEAGTPVVQGVDEMTVLELGWRQRFQTKRGPPGRRQNVDWLTLDLETTFYSNTDPPEITPDGKQAHDHLDFMTEWRVTDSAAVWTDTNFNLDGGTLDLFTVGATVTHTPRLSYTVGHRYIPDADSAMALVGFDYQINEKWRMTFLQQFDFDRNENAQSNFILSRRMHRWLVRFRIELDPGEDESFVGLEFQPLGASEIQLGG